jgi:acetyl-CoA acetyltransferase
MRSREALIAGVYTTEQGELTGRAHHELLREAIVGALDDAGLSLGDLDGIANIRSETKSASAAAPGLWAELLGKNLTYHDMVDVAGASHCASVAHAAAHIEAGLCDVVAVVGGWIRGSRREIIQEMAYMHGEFDASWGSLAASWFAMIAQMYMRTRSVTASQMAAVAVAERQWAALHPQAIRKAPLSTQDVLESRLVCDPLHMLDCCGTNNGAGAVVLAAADRVGGSPYRGVRVIGSGECYSGRGYSDIRSSLDSHGARISAARAMEQAGVTAADLGVLGLYDPFSFMPLYLLEEIGVCEEGAAGGLAEAGELQPGGKLAVNTHGGALSWGNSINALGHLIEVVRQLQGRAGERQVKNADVGLVHGFGGTLSLNSTVVLS